MSGLALLLKRILGRGWKPKRRPERQPSILETIPPELLLCITDFLDNPDPVCLALCSHWLLHVISKGDPTSLLSRYRPTSKLKAALLTRIARDMPDQFACLRCATLHPISDVQHPASTLLNMKHPCPDISKVSRGDFPLQLYMLFIGCSMFTQYDFRHGHLVVAMKNHLKGGTQGITVQSLAYTEVMDGFSDPRVTELRSVEARVCALEPGQEDGEVKSTLILQVQTWVLFHSGSDKGLVDSILDVTKICAHKRVGSVVRRRCGANLDVDLHSEGLVLGQQCCSACGVEFRIDLRACQDKGRAVVVTKWVDLGAGFDLDDPKWRRALSCPNWEERYQVTTAPGDVARMFHGAGSIGSLDSVLTERNRAYLIGEQYRRSLHRNTLPFYSSVPRPSLEVEIEHWTRRR
ncbi:hypothetical protein BJY04DRAFT_221197 [Aspergillus karnatakaensis]|uniref:uncharacterized protein n=1 Tax=Aspergillus karnatakaensis TaxID=1810916 RepID=UPI003CCDDCEE